MDVNRQPFGQAGTPRQVLQPALTTRLRYPAGPFGAELRPSLIANRQGAYSGHLTLGLLIGKPDVDGTGGRELVWPGYRRQTIELVDRNRSQFAVGRPVLFDIHACPSIELLALFNEEDHVEAFGALRPHGKGDAPPSRFEFAAFQILVKRVKSR